ncbi:A24 family peptidase [Bosea vaviloviae]|uniref:Peptidase n=1 Tax=Bosea vaviloviae TaxID=1526658 RepID=A0A1D7TY88_9HYPH|nr:prepilin peptidase [Bosea vaviloviae]AOO80083.1 peptidase [Bosea vaviloviae]
MSLSLVILLVIFPAIMAFAASSDLISMTISNRLCLLLIVAFALCALLLGLSWSQIGWHLAAGGLVLSVCFGMFAAGWIGGGDAKFAAAVALWFGFGQLMPYLMLAGIAGGVLTLAILSLRSGPLPAMVAGWPWMRRLHAANEGVPYGIALAFSALFVLPDTDLWRAAIGA